MGEGNRHEGRWERAVQLLQLLAAVAGLTAWIVFVGGVRVYQRLGAAELPAPTRTVTLLPRETLLAEGIRALAVSVLFAVGVAIVILLFGAVFVRDDPPRVHYVPRSVLLTVLTASAVLVAIGTRWGELSWEAWAWVGVLTVIVGVLGALALTRWTRPPPIALIAAAAILVWGGSFSLLAERGMKHPPFEPVQLVRADGSGLKGFLLAHGDKTITVICAGAEPSLLTVHSNEVRQVSHQRDQALYESPERDCQTIDAIDAQPPPAQPDPMSGDLLGGLLAFLERLRDVQDKAEPGCPGTPPPAPVDTRGPGLAIPRGQVAQETPEGRFVLRLGVSCERVSGVASVKVDRSGEAPLRLATKSFQASINNSANIRFGLSAAARKALADRTRISARLVVIARDMLGNATTKSLAVTLEPR